MGTKRILLYILLSASILHLTSCINEMNEGGIADEKKEILFNAFSPSVTITRAGESHTVYQVSSPATEKLFMGMLENDSLFLQITEETADFKEYEQAQTKAGDNSKPSSFQITGFKDNEASPYVNLTVSSSDGWKSYSPSLYWPDKYQHLHFFASTPNSGNALFSPTYTKAGQNTYASASSFEFTPEEKAQTDIIYAIATGQNEDNAPVDLQFYHALSSVEFILGDIGNAVVDNAVVTMNNIISSGQCLMTDPLTPESIVWDTEGRNCGGYTQTISDGNGYPFRLVPQNISGATITVELKIGNKTHIFEDIAIATQNMATWKPNKKYIYTITKGHQVGIEVGNSGSNTLINNVKILNSGFTRSYIRAAIIGYWAVEGETEEIVSSWHIEDTNTGTLLKPDDWNTKWKEVDGIYYHKQPVDAGAYTSTLISSYTLLKETGPVPGSVLKISIVTQAIDASEVADAKAEWPALAEIIDINAANEEQ